MRWIGLWLVLISTAPLARAQDISPLDVCRIYGDSAAAIMQARQDGTSYIDARAEFGRDGNADLERLIDAAFARPRMPTPRLATIEVQEMRNAVEKACLGMMPSE